MAIGTDEIEFFDELDDFTPQDDNTIIDNKDQNPGQDPDPNDGDKDKNQPEEDFMTFLLKSRGIEDRSKIKFENDEDSAEEVDWDSLSNEDKLNIINSSAGNLETALDESEIQLINSIRESGLTTAEYIQQIETEGVNRYVQNIQNSQYEYTVDQYTDDELFIADFMERMGATEDEAREELERSKSNEALFTKKIGAIRNEYKTIEEENIRQAQIEQEQQAQEKYDQFAQQVVDQINDLKEFSGYDLNLEQDDMQMLYDFITGVDKAGNNHFAKALSDPKTLVQTAWLALNGKQMIDDITDYFQKEITKVRKESYEKGLAAAKDKINKPDVVFKDKQKTQQMEIYNDLDEF